MTRRLFFVFAGLYFVVAGVIAVALMRASPGPSEQDIHGIGIGSYDKPGGIMYISGRRLHCIPTPQPSAYTSQCSIPIEGKPLTILAAHNHATPLDDFDGSCQASYDERSWPCHFRWRHVHVPWFAYLDAPLTLSAQQLDALRRQYWIENLPEAVFLRFAGVSVVASTAMAALLSMLWWWPTRTNRLGILSRVAVVSLIAMLGSGIGALFLISGFWD